MRHFFIFWILHFALLLPATALAGGAPLMEERAVFSALTGAEAAHVRSLVIVDPSSYPTVVSLNDDGDMVMILTSHDPDFRWVQQFHETYHLMTGAHFFDFYNEGLATRYSEAMFAHYGWDWTPHQRYFDSVPGSFHSLAYALINDLMSEIQVGHVWSMARYRANDGYGEYIDIDAWLVSLPDGERRAACAVLRRYHESSLVMAALRQMNDSGYTMQFAVQTAGC